MKNRLSLLVAFLITIVFATPVVAAPPEGDPVAVEESKADSKAGEPKSVEIKTDEEAAESVTGVYTALANRDWALVIALGLTIVVFVLRKVKVLAKVPAKAVPLVTAFLAMGGYLAAALMTPGVAIGTAVMEGLAVGASAVGLWEMLLKNFLSAKS